MREHQPPQRTRHQRAMEKFTHSIEWPNGLGETPCTKEYSDAHDAAEAAATALYGAGWPHGEWLPESEQSPEAYEAYHRAVAARDQLQLEGHLGKSIRY